MRERIGSEDGELRQVNVIFNYKNDSEQAPWNRIVEQSSPSESMQARIVRVRKDIECLEQFYSIEISPLRTARFHKYYEDQINDLEAVEFEHLDQSDKIDYLNLRNYLQQALRQNQFNHERNIKIEHLIPFQGIIIGLCQDRQHMKPMDAKKMADNLHKAKKQAKSCIEKLQNGETLQFSKNTAFRAANMILKLREILAEWFGFYNRYDPLFSWWVPEPYQKMDVAMKELATTIREKIVGIKPGDEDVIVGEPIGRDGLLSDLEAEMIAYTPEELLQIADREYPWCEAEAKKASNELGYGDDWRKAMEYVKTLYVEPGKQTELVRDLMIEATEYVKKYDLVTVPQICEETTRMYMMSPARQKVNPFFLGGETIQVSYPTDGMDYEDKMMSMRGNNVHFSRSTVFHELIPGHHLQMYMNDRVRPYRWMFWTPFSTEGWALYWEFLLWDKETFPKTPENRMGMLFWRMHRCARIIFSIKFHLGQMTPQECIDLLVDMVDHERATAEGEVRRSFNGDYSPLYQAGYMLGALQLYALRHELVDGGKMKEKEFHDRIMNEGQMPIELLRALMEEKHVTRDYKASWRFYKHQDAEK